MVTVQLLKQVNDKRWQFHMSKKCSDKTKTQATSNEKEREDKTSQRQGISFIFYLSQSLNCGHDGPLIWRVLVKCLDISTYLELSKPSTYSISALCQASKLWSHKQRITGYTQQNKRLKKCLELFIFYYVCFLC